MINFEWEKSFNSVEIGYDLLLLALREWGVSVCVGVTGGGLVHLLKKISPFRFDVDEKDELSFLTLGEYVAGYVPLGGYLATGRIGAALATTGAATKLLACGISDAKLHDIPSVYIVPVSRRSTYGLAPVQDTSVHGSNIVAQLNSEVPGSVFVLDDMETLHQVLIRAGEQLARGKPIVLILEHDALSLPLPKLVSKSLVPTVRSFNAPGLVRAFIDKLRDASLSKRLVILVGEELCRYRGIAPAITKLSENLRAPVLWSMNGANAIERCNRYAYGYILFGGNDVSTQRWNSIGEDDVLLILGACLDEYTVNLQEIRAASTFFVSNIEDGYGQIGGSIRHRVRGTCHELRAPLDIVVRELVVAAKEGVFKNQYEIPAPEDLNPGQYTDSAKNCVDMVQLYRRLDKWWPPNSFGVDDVCLAYKDRQFITQRPHPNIRFYSLYRGSAMGGAFGVAIGAKLSAPNKNVFLFTGDGCFRYFAGYLGEVRELGIVTFVLNNRDYAIASQVYRFLLPNTDSRRYHTDLYSLDFTGIARASGWRAHTLNSDLSNLDEILDQSRNEPRHSMLIDVPVDSKQELGRNPRRGNL
jgi:acetolactate synthase-1/2/3 large subunit